MSEEAGSTPERRGGYAALLRDALLFCIPIVAFAAVGPWWLVRSGEIACTNPPDIIARQRSGETSLLYGPAYFDCSARVKFVGAMEKAPQILVLGTSRAMEIRSAFFTRSFYNAGGAIVRMRDLDTFIRGMPEGREPRVVVLVLDHFLFVEASDREASVEFADRKSALYECPSPRAILLNSWNRVFYEVVSGRIPLDEVFDPPFAPGAGVRAHYKGEGFRADGSLRVTRVDGYDDTHARMAGERRRYEAATELTPWLVRELDAFLGYAASRDIHIVALLPPYTPTIYDELKARGRWPYLWRTYADLAPVFARRGMELYDYTDPRALGLTDTDFYDGHHGTERAYAKILLDAAKRSPTLAAVVDAPRIVRMLEDTNDRLSIAGDSSAGE